MTVFAVERFADLLGEIEPLWQAHYVDAGADRHAVPFDMDVERYVAIDAAGCLIVVAARHDGALVGYLVALVGSHLHCASVLQASCDLHYLAPRHRGGRVAKRLFEAFEAEAVRRGVMRIMVGTPATNDQGRLLVALGCRPIETVYAKVIV